MTLVETHFPEGLGAARMQSISEANIEVVLNYVMRARALELSLLG
jgi:hypothetical protein